LSRHCHFGGENVDKIITLTPRDRSLRVPLRQRVRRHLLFRQAATSGEGEHRQEVQEGVDAEEQHHAPAASQSIEITAFCAFLQHSKRVFFYNLSYFR
jgi:hypothetical protein